MQNDEIIEAVANILAKRKENNRDAKESLHKLMEASDNYSEELADWLEKNKGISNLSAQHKLFLSGLLTKFIVENPAIILCRDEFVIITRIMFTLGYRTGWEAAKADNIVGGK